MFNYFTHALQSKRQITASALLCTALLSLNLTGCGGGSSSKAPSVSNASVVSTPSPSTSPNLTIMPAASNSYSMGSIPLSGLVTFHSATTITYATDNVGFLVLLGNFTYPSSTTTNTTAVLANLSGISGTISGIGHYNSAQQLLVSITQLNIPVNKIEGYIESVDIYDIWQTIASASASSSSNALFVTNATGTLTCPTPSSLVSPATLTITSANQNIASFIASSCIK